MREQAGSLPGTPLFKETELRSLEGVARQDIDQIESSPEQLACYAMLPFAALAALLAVASLGGLRTWREWKNDRAQEEHDLRRQKEWDEIARLRELRAKDDELRHTAWDEDQLRHNLWCACRSFGSAVYEMSSHSNQQRSRLADSFVPPQKFDTVESAMAMIPDLVWHRFLPVETARLLEEHTSQLAVVDGEIRTVTEEQQRIEYLDKVKPAGR